MLLNVLLISGGIHVLALFILGGITVYKFIIPDEAKFEAPPEIVEEQPPPEVKVEIKPKPAPQDEAMSKLRMKQVNNIAISAIDVDLPDMEGSFTVSGGLGGTGGGSLLGGASGRLGIGMSDINIFGLKSRAERVLFVIDANRHMVTDAKGGLNSFKVIKDEITNMVGNFSAGTLFNVMIVDRRKHKLFKPQLVSAGDEVHQQLVEWMRPINANASSPGLEGASGVTIEQLQVLADNPVHKALTTSKVYGMMASNETAFITQAALEQRVDAIFIIAGYHRGFEEIRREPTTVEKQNWERIISQPKYKEQLIKHNQEVPVMKERIRVLLNKINAERKAKGQPERVLDSRWPVYQEAKELGLKWNTPHPGWEPAYFFDPRTISGYFKELVDVIYRQKGAQTPSVNVVLFLAGDEEMRKDWEDQLKEYVRFFSGKYRIIRGLNEIKSASGAAETTN